MLVSVQQDAWQPVSSTPTDFPVEPLIGGIAMLAVGAGLAQSVNKPLAGVFLTMFKTEGRIVTAELYPTLCNVSHAEARIGAIIWT